MRVDSSIYDLKNVTACRPRVHEIFSAKSSKPWWISADSVHQSYRYSCMIQALFISVKPTRIKPSIFGSLSIRTQTAAFWSERCKTIAYFFIKCGFPSIKRFTDVSPASKNAEMTANLVREPIHDHPEKSVHWIRILCVNLAESMYDIYQHLNIRTSSMLLDVSITWHNPSDLQPSNQPDRTTWIISY